MKLIQVHRFSGNGRDGDTLDQCIDAAKRFGFDGLLVKALDGVSWMADYDSGQDAISSADEVAAQRDHCHAAGLKYFVWTVPLHDVDLDVQAGRTSAAALAADGLFLDVEPYARTPTAPPFWGPLRPVGLARSFMQKIRDRAPAAWLCLQPDPRPARLAEIRPEEWFPFVDAFSGQHYWTDFDNNTANWPTVARLELARAAEIGQTWHKPILPTLPGTSPTTAVPVDLLRGFGGLVVFRLGTTGEAMLRLLGGLTLHGTTDEQPGAVDPFAPLVTSLAYVCDTVGDQIFAAADKLDGEGDAFRELVSEMRRVRAQIVGARPQPGLPVPEAEPEPPPGPVYNPNTTLLTQPNGWACSVFSATMALQSMDVQLDWLEVRGELGDAVHSITEPLGLQDARGPALVQLFKNHGFASDAIPWNRGNGGSWDEVLERAGRMPVLLGGLTWGHWSFVRGVEAGRLSLGNPAPNHMGVDQLMNRDQFARLGPWTIVWIDLAGAPIQEDPVRIQQLELEIDQLKGEVQAKQDGIDSLVVGLAHVADKLVPELADSATSAARRTELLDVVKSIRATLVGPTDAAPPPPPPATTGPAHAEAPAGPGVTTKRGINLDWLNPGASPPPDELVGFDWVRLIAHPRGSVHPDPARANETLGDYLDQLHALGIRSIVVLPQQAFGELGAIVPRMHEYATDLNPDVWQIGNEPDAGWHPANTEFENTAAERHKKSEASWCLDPADFANLIFNCAPIIREHRPDARIITAGMACGFPEWLDQPTWNAVLEHVDGVAVHPYLKKPQADWPDNGVVEGAQRAFVGELLEQYHAALGDATPLWITEFGTTDHALHTEYYARMYVTLEGRLDVQAACAFCYSDAMDDRGYALLDSGAWTPLLTSPPLSFA